MKIHIAASLLCSLALAAPALALAPHHASQTAIQSHREQGDREVRALNLLEASGYRNISAVDRAGHEFKATATKRGTLYNVTVAATGKIAAHQI